MTSGTSTEYGYITNVNNSGEIVLPDLISGGDLTAEEFHTYKSLINDSYSNPSSSW